MDIRAATVADSDAACKVVRRSIIELCEQDHHNDPSFLQRWLANKTPPHVAGWIANPDNCVVVATEDNAVLAVGAMTTDGMITLNYVSPDARFKGISRALLNYLEAIARDLGHDICRLTSTETALPFYRSAGYVPDGTPQDRFGRASSHPMMKRLVVPA